MIYSLPTTVDIPSQVPMPNASPGTALATTDASPGGEAADALRYLEELCAAGDVKLLDRRFLDAACQLLRAEHALLYISSSRGTLTRIKRYWEPQARRYDTCWQQVPPSDAERALAEQARGSAGGARRALGPDLTQIAFHHRGDGGRAVTVLVAFPAATNESLVDVFAGFTRSYLSLRAFMDDSQRDPLTGLLNRRYFDDCINRALEAIEDAKAPGRVVDALRRSTDSKPSRFWLAILDIDHFKRFNDAYGHLYGDEILLLFARIMEQTFRDTDLLFRFGGEEFIVLMENTSDAEALGALERFRCAVAAYPFPQGEQVTVSAGATEALGDCSATTLLGRADEALYYAKEHGRNRTEIYEQLQAAGAIHSGSGSIATDIELF